MITKLTPIEINILTQQQYRDKTQVNLMNYTRISVSKTTNNKLYGGDRVISKRTV